MNEFVLAMAMLSDASPHFFHHAQATSGCAGTRGPAVAVVATVATPVRNFAVAVRERFAERPRLAFVRPHTAAVSLGSCSGMRTAVGAGCAGSFGVGTGYRAVNGVVYAPMPQAPPAAVVEGAFRDRLADGHFERALKRQYRRMAPNDPNRAAVAKAISDDDARAELRARLTAKMKAGQLADPGPHPVLEQLILWLEQNWLTILTEILKMFG